MCLSPPSLSLTKCTYSCSLRFFVQLEGNRFGRQSSGNRDPPRQRPCLQWGTSALAGLSWLLSHVPRKTRRYKSYWTLRPQQRWHTKTTDVVWGKWMWQDVVACERLQSGEQNIYALKPTVCCVPSLVRAILKMTELEWRDVQYNLSGFKWCFECNKRKC